LNSLEKLFDIVSDRIDVDQEEGANKYIRFRIGALLSRDAVDIGILFRCVHTVNELGIGFEGITRFDEEGALCTDGMPAGRTPQWPRINTNGDI
jgi:hypothetical protein